MRIVASLLLLLAAGVGAEEPFLLGGIQVNEPDHERWVATLEQVGMNTVAVTVYAHQGDWASDHLWWADEEPAATLGESGEAEVASPAPAAVGGAE